MKTKDNSHREPFDFYRLPKWAKCALCCITGALIAIICIISLIMPAYWAFTKDKIGYLLLYAVQLGAFCGYKFYEEEF